MSRPSSVDSLAGNNLRKSGKSSGRREKKEPEPIEKEKLTAADRRAIKMAKAYGGEPPVKKKKNPKKKKFDGSPTSGEGGRPLTDRLYPSLL